VTLKVKPKPEAAAAVAFGCNGESLGAVLDLLHDSQSRPAAVEVLNAAAWRAAGSNLSFSSDWVIAVGFEEKAGTVRWQLDTLRDELKATPVRDFTEVPDPAGLWAAVTGLQVQPESRLIAKGSVPPSRLADGVRNLGGLVHAHALTGVYWVHDGDRPAAAVLRRCPPDRKKDLPVWGPPPPAWDLMRHVKTTLDPDGVFNPGRLFGDV
jgi:glycolate oxidase FAD binding subunit